MVEVIMHVILIYFVILVAPRMRAANPVDNISDEEILTIREIINDGNYTLPTQLTPIPGTNTCKALPWPKGDMTFLIPRKINTNDSIFLELLLNPNRSNVTVNLAAADNDGNLDYRNIIWQQILDFTNSKTYSRRIQNGTEAGYRETTDPLTNIDIGGEPSYPSEDTSNKCKLTIFIKEDRVDCRLGESYFTAELQVEHEYEPDIRFISVSGDVERVIRLSFNYA